MKQRYYLTTFLRYCLLLAFGLGSGFAAVAQSGPYGNEWIVPGQPYYKIKVTRNSLYRLDYAYLTRAGITSADPSRFQLWRRGKEVAIYVGGNSATTLDASTFIEFYGQRNDGVLDVDLYKNPADHYVKNYSLYTDTATYFLTIASTATGRKRMAQVNPAPVGGAHPYWRYRRVEVNTDDYNSNVDLEQFVFLPWGEPAEGFFTYPFSRVVFARDSLVNPAVTGGPLPLVEIQIVGSSRAAYQMTVLAGPAANNTTHTLESRLEFRNFEQRKVAYSVSRNDINASGIGYFSITMPTTAADPQRFRIGSIRSTSSQPAVWNPDRATARFSNDSTLGSAPAYYSLDNLPATVCGFDVTDPYNVQRVDGRSEGGSRRGYVFPSALPGSKQRELMLVDETKAMTPLPATRQQFAAINPAAYTYLIISSQRLMKPAGSLANPVQAYADYRASALGGSYQPLVVTSEQLYDQFHYGEKSVLALRHFALYMLTNSRPKSLLLLGKGLMPNEFDSNVYFRKDPDNYHAPGGPNVRDLVPTSMRGASDIFLTADWQNGSYAARMPTGRVSAQTPAEVAAYLKKVQEYEDVISRPDAPDLAWRKNALNIAGGENQSEFEEFGSYLNDYKRHIESPLFAGKVVKTYARTNPSLPVPLSIAPELNAGLSIINYFGHGGSDILDFDLGNPEDASSGYNNNKKYPVMFVGGCAAGNAFRARKALFAESWLFVPDKGLVGFMAGADEGFANSIHLVEDTFFKVLLNDPQWYGKPIAEVQNEVGRRLTPLAESQGLNANSHGLQSSLMSTIWHADPALRLFSPAQPDYTFGTPAVEIKPVGTNPLLATSPQFQLVVKVRNPGKVTYDKLDISVRRQYDKVLNPTRADTLYTFNALPAILHDTTFVLTLRNSGAPIGTNQFTVTLDYQNRVAELNEANNTATTSFVFLRPGLSLLSPPEFGIVASNNLRLVGQTNVTRGVRSFEVELDTVPTFTSGAVRRTLVQAAQVAEWRPALPATVAGRDSVVWYWRMRFAATLDPSENREWSTSSFRVINDGTEGWSQSHYGQFNRDELKRLQVAAPSGKWSFTDLSQPITLRTRGAGKGGVTFDATYGVQLGADQLSVLSCGIGVPNLLVSVIDGASLQSLRNIRGGAYDSCGTAPNRFYHFATSTTDSLNSVVRQQQLLSLLTNVPAGAYVALVSVNGVNFSALSPAVKAALTALGAQKIGQLQNGDPYVLLARKGFASFAQEATFDPGQPGTRTTQVVSVSRTLTSSTGSGVLTSTLIGPAQQWTTLHHTVRPGATGSYTLQLIGVDASQRETVLNANVTNRALPLTGVVSAAQYPFLKLRLVLRDTLNRTAPQVKQLLVAYRGLPEGVVRADSVRATTPLAYDPATLAAQAATGFVSVPVIFSNVTPLPFGTPLKARLTLRSSGTGTPPTGAGEKITYVTLPPLAANRVVAFTARADVRDLSGDITLQVDVNQDQGGVRLPEQFYFNNVLTLPTFRVENNNLPPVLDVAFDGLHILNGDIVKPAPLITVLLTDDNRLRPIANATAFDLVLIRPDGTQTRVDVSGSNVVFRADSTKGTATLEYQPGKDKPLPDGKYTLQVQGRDASGTAATTGTPYTIAFEVVNASTITHLYPYPNPITNKAKFVFTLTGSELPRAIRIQVMTLTGRVVRDIALSDFRIGNNITDYVWDGTDEFGDRLANGTYLYRVVMDSAGQFERRKTAGDKAFKNEWGKLVLLH